MSTFTPGFHRIHLASVADGDFVTLYAPLDADGRLDRSAPRPHLCAGRWNGADFYGELRLGGVSARTHDLNHFVIGEEQTLTDLFTTPLTVGKPVMFYVGDSTDGESWPFVVRDIRRV